MTLTLEKLAEVDRVLRRDFHERMTMTDDKQDEKPETKGAADVQAIQRIIRILDGLKRSELERVLQFIMDKYEREPAE